MTTGLFNFAKCGKRDRIKAKDKICSFRRE
jgi:hypothetical protein